MQQDLLAMPDASLTCPICLRTCRDTVLFAVRLTVIDDCDPENTKVLFVERQCCRGCRSKIRYTGRVSVVVGAAILAGVLPIGAINFYYDTPIFFDAIALAGIEVGIGVMAMLKLVRIVPDTSIRDKQLLRYVRSISRRRFRNVNPIIVACQAVPEGATYLPWQPPRTLAQGR